MVITENQIRAADGFRYTTFQVVTTLSILRITFMILCAHYPGSAMKP